MYNSTGKTNNTLSPVSTTVLIFVMFGSSVGFIWWTLRVTIQNSQVTEGAVGVFAHVFECCCKRKEVPVSNAVPFCTNSDADTIAALRIQVEALKNKARKQTTQIVPLKQSGLRSRSRSRGVMGRAGTIKGSLRYQAKVAVVMKRAKDNVDAHDVSSIARKKQREVQRTQAKSRLADRLKSRSRKKLSGNNMVVPMMVPTSNEAVGTPKEETVALQVTKLDIKKKQTGMGVETIEPLTTTETVITTTTVKQTMEDVNTLPHVAQIRSLVAGAMKTSTRLRKTCTRLNNGDASVNTISKEQFEMLVAHIIKKDQQQKKNTIEMHFFKEETWNFIVGKDKEINVISFDQLEKWLFSDPLALVD